MSNGKDLAVQHTPSQSTFSMVPRSFEEALKFAELMAKSDLVPKDFKDKPGNILVAIQKGHEVGLSPMSALETIAVINGRASLWGDGMLALVQSHFAYEAIDEGQSTDKEGVCRIKRKGEAWYEVRFSLEDAKRAGLLGKAGPWTAYTKRMLQLRARSFALRDKFADALKGLIAAEEALDIAVTAELKDDPRPTLKDKLKVQVEGPSDKLRDEVGQQDMTLPPQEVETVEPPDPIMPVMDDSLNMDRRIVFQDHLAMIESATTVAALSNETNAALDNQLLTAEQKAAVRILRDKRMAALQKKK